MNLYLQYGHKCIADTTPAIDIVLSLVLWLLYLGTGLDVKKNMIEVVGTRRRDQDFEQDVNSCTLSQFYLSH